MATLAERKAEYEAHQVAGQDYYNSVRSQLTLDVEAGTRTLIEAVSIQQQLYWVGCNLHTGDYKSALLACNALNTNDTLTQAYLDQIKADIQTYITNNYSW